MAGIFFLFFIAFNNICFCSEFDVFSTEFWT